MLNTTFYSTRECAKLGVNRSQLGDIAHRYTNPHDNKMLWGTGEIRVRDLDIEGKSLAAVMCGGQDFGDAMVVFCLPSEKDGIVKDMTNKGHRLPETVDAPH